ncbi:MAG TPA: hypothetical protein VH541_02870 [Gaiellaceae bacterium]|jgi:hypothetical protein
MSETKTSTPILEPLIDERSKVESWRLHILIEAGYPLSLAERLAVSDADLHLACEMLGRGCLPETAAEILL